MANGDEMVTVEQLKLFEDTKLSSSLKLVSGYAIGTYSGIPIQNLVMAKDPEDVGAGTVQMGIDGDHGNVQIIGLIGDSKVAIQATTENEVAIMAEAENVRAGIGVSNASPVMVFGSKQILSITDDASTGDTNALATAKAVKDYVDANGSSVDVFFEGQERLSLSTPKVINVTDLTTKYVLIGIVASSDGMGTSWYQKTLIPISGYGVRDTGIHLNIECTDSAIEVTAINTSSMDLRKVFGIK